MAKMNIFLFLCFSNLHFHCGYIEANRAHKYSSLRFCPWNLNGLTAHDSIKISSLQVSVTQLNYDIVYVSERFLNSFIQTEDERILIDGYNTMRADHPSDSKKV